MTHVPCGVLLKLKRTTGLLSDDMRHDIMTNFVLTWYKLSFFIGQFEIEVQYNTVFVLTESSISLHLRSLKNYLMSFFMLVLKPNLY
jgi:hypothetical protein